jgi:hypothetical protein
MVGAGTEADERDVRTLPRRHRGDVADVDLPGDDFVTEPGDDSGEALEPVCSLIRDQDAEVVDPVQWSLPVERSDTANGRNETPPSSFVARARL